MSDITYQEQLDRWVAGDSVHRDGGCCPDFSCCKPELASDPEVRATFAASSEADRFAFLGLFLHAAIALAGRDRALEGNAPRVAVLGALPKASS